MKIFREIIEGYTKKQLLLVFTLPIIPGYLLLMTTGNMYISYLCMYLIDVLLVLHWSHKKKI